MFYPTGGLYTIQDITEQRAPIMEVLALKSEYVPDTFNMLLWQEQAARYLKYWNWFNGTELSAVRIKSKDPKKDILKYPLGINTIRNFARKHASVLLGEEMNDSPQPLVMTVCSPKPRLDGEDSSSEEDKKLSRTLQNVVNTVWTDSRGRAMQMEAATLSQVLGGYAFQINWVPWRKNELQIPITVKGIMPDFFLPVWATSDDYWDLLEAFVIYRIPGTVAKQKYGSAMGPMGWSTYCEHWTKETYSIMVDGKFVTSSFSGKMVTYNKIENPFKFVPFVYIPHLREGGFFGHSHVEDIEGLTRELNARSADIGDSIRETVHRERFARDLPELPTLVELPTGRTAVDLGSANPVTKASPDIFSLDPPTLPQGLTDFPEFLWRQLLREGHMSSIAFGEDEGSQRSALTLAFRMWPLTAHIRAERTNWTDGLNEIARKIVKMAQIKQADIPALQSVKVPEDFQARFNLSQDWKPMIPRDREQIVNETVLRNQADLQPPQDAIKILDGSEFVDEKMTQIREWMEFKAKLNQKPEISETDPKTLVAEPIAASGVEE